jgi:membrane associated rhomboid family serine protease
MFPLYDNNPIQRTPVVTYLLVAINVVVFLWMSRLSEVQQEVLAYQHGFVPARVIQLSQPRPIQVPIEVAVYDPFLGGHIEQRALELPANPRQIWASLFTCMFMHGGWMHLLLNMWFLWLFGDNVEDRLGPVLYLFIYIVGGLLGSGVHWWANPNSMVPVIGASGAIAAVLGAYAITWPWARVSTLVVLVVFVTIIDIPALVVLGAWFVGQVLSLGNAANSGVALWAHVGGFMAGMALMPPLSLLAGATETPVQAEIVE